MIKYVNEKPVFNILDSNIKTVELGSIKTNPNNPVIAIGLSETYKDKLVKVIVKNDLAKIVYNNFLKDRLSLSGELPTSESKEYFIDKEVLISFYANLKEERKSGIVLENPKDFSFSFNYNIIKK